MNLPALSFSMMLAMCSVSLPSESLSPVQCFHQIGMLIGMLTQLRPGVSINSNSGPSLHQLPFSSVVSLVHDVGSSLVGKASLPRSKLPRELFPAPVVPTRTIRGGAGK